MMINPAPDSQLLAALHAPLEPILRFVLRPFAPVEGVVLDVACGPGVKLPLLAQICGPRASLVALDLDRAAMRRAHTYGVASLVSDAQALPFSTGSVQLACCIAALNQFVDPAAALRDMGRVTYPQGRVLVVTAAYEWARIVRWPSEAGRQLAAAWSGLPDTERQRASIHLEHGAGLGRLFDQAKLTSGDRRAFLLEAAVSPALAELALLPWQATRPLVAELLSPTELRACDVAAARAEIALVELAITACGQRRGD